MEGGSPFAVTAHQWGCLSHPKVAEISRLVNQMDTVPRRTRRTLVTRVRVMRGSLSILTSKSHRAWPLSQRRCGLRRKMEFVFAIRCHQCTCNQLHTPRAGGVRFLAETGCQVSGDVMYSYQLALNWTGQKDLCLKDFGPSFGTKDFWWGEYVARC